MKLYKLQHAVRVIKMKDNMTVDYLTACYSLYRFIDESPKKNRAIVKQKLDKATLSNSEYVGKAVYWLVANNKPIQDLQRITYSRLLQVRGKLNAVLKSGDNVSIENIFKDIVGGATNKELAQKYRAKASSGRPKANKPEILSETRNPTDLVDEIIKALPLLDRANLKKIACAIGKQYNSKPATTKKSKGKAKK